MWVLRVGMNMASKTSMAQAMSSILGPPIFFFYESLLPFPQEFHQLDILEIWSNSPALHVVHDMLLLKSGLGWQINSLNIV